MTPRLVKVLKAGRTSYGSGLQLQKVLADQHYKKDFKGETPNTLILLEHNPVYTVGIRNKGYTDEDVATLRQVGAEFYKTNRGGLITFHGHGQLVAYPIISMKEFHTNIRCYVNQIEKMIIRLCSEFGLKGKTSPDTGVWVDDKKICAIGIHGSRYITTHGLALNCNTDLSWFNHIVPCGIEEKGVTSISKELSMDVTIDDVIPILQNAFENEFECELIEFHPEEASELLRESKDKSLQLL